MTRDYENMPWLAHAIELRKRLILSFAGFLVATALCYPGSLLVQDILTLPLARALAAVRTDASARMIFTTLTEAFVTRLKLSLFSGFLVAFPWIAYHVWRFVAPGLFAHERRLFFAGVISAPCLLLLGASFAYFFVFPAAWSFFLTFEQTSSTFPLQLEARVSDYIATSLELMLAFGLCFQLPLVLFLLRHTGILQHETLVNGRKYAFLLILCVAALITPPDILSPILLTIPIYALYESSIIVSWQMLKKRPATPHQPPSA